MSTTKHELPIYQPSNRSNSQNSRNYNRMVVIDQFHYINPDSPQGMSSETRYSMSIQSEEQPYVRYSKVGEEWTLLDLGWIRDSKSTGMVKILNVKKEFTVQPTLAETDEADRKILDYGILSSEDGTGNGLNSVIPIGFILAGQDARLQPFDIRKFYIRCRSGEGRYGLYIMP